MLYRFLILVLISMLFLTSTVFSDTTYVSGDVSGIWEASGSPYLVNGEIHVPTDSSLRIMPGCSVIFQGHYKFCVDSNAVLKAIGNEIDSIIFTAVDTNLTDSSGGHHGIRFYYSSESCTLSYCIIEYGNACEDYYPDCHGGGISCYLTSLIIANCRIEKNRANWCGGGFASLGGGTPIIERTCFVNNYAQKGGGIYCLGELNCQYCSISNNVAIYWGGGIYCWHSSLTLEYSTIQNNLTQSGGGVYSDYSNIILSANIISSNNSNSGGGVLCMNSDCTIIDNVFSNNNVDGGTGGGIMLYGTTSTIDGNTITFNFALRGGGIDCNYSNGNITENTITDNIGYLHGGGGISCNFDSEFSIENNTVIRNVAEGYYGGGGISFRGSDPIISKNIIKYNLAPKGGGVYASFSKAKITNNIIAGNSSTYGGGIYCYLDSDIILINNNIINNIADSIGGAICCEKYSDPVTFNNIFYNNSAEIANEAFLGLNSYDSTYYCTLFISCSVIDSNDCVISPGSAIIRGVGNINLNPFFADTLFHLSEDSPCIDAGAEFAISPWGDTVWAPTEDFEGGFRPFGLSWDIGADEYGTDFVFETPQIKPENLTIYAYPNPFNGSISIEIDCVRAIGQSPPQIEIYDINGRLVFTDEPIQGIGFRSFFPKTPRQRCSYDRLEAYPYKVSGEAEPIHSSKHPAIHSVYTWTPDPSLPSGVYFIRASTKPLTASRKVLYLK
ncbi:right-handed parallel beta-helix repeat-containing protein [bacterium]|nr:right-handed parallel beta-helix repeat-containing protein [bacterium]